LRGIKKSKATAKRATARKGAQAKKSRKKISRSANIRLWWVARGLLAGIGVVAAVLALVYGADKVMKLPSLSVKNVKITGYSEIKPEQVVKISGIRTGEPLLKVDLDKVRKRVASHPKISDAVVGRELPDTVHIDISERKPEAIIMDRSFFTVDSEGVVLAKNRRYPGTFPIITGVRGPWKFGERIDDALPGLLVLRALAECSLPEVQKISEVRLKRDGRVIVSLMERGTVLIMTPGGLENEVKRLVKMVESGNFDSSAAGYDLRFSGRVVKLPGRDETTRKLNNSSGAGGSANGQG
jgi:hypothetical protein